MSQEIVQESEFESREVTCHSCGKRFKISILCTEEECNDLHSEFSLCCLSCLRKEQKHMRKSTKKTYEGICPNCHIPTDFSFRLGNCKETYDAVQCVSCKRWYHYQCVHSNFEFAPKFPIDSEDLACSQCHLEAASWTSEMIPIVMKNMGAMSEETKVSAFGRHYSDMNNFEENLIDLNKIVKIQINPVFIELLSCGSDHTVRDVCSGLRTAFRADGLELKWIAGREQVLPPCRFVSRDPHDEEQRRVEVYTPDTSILVSQTTIGNWISKEPSIGTKIGVKNKKVLLGNGLLELKTVKNRKNTKQKTTHFSLVWFYGFYLILFKLALDQRKGIIIDEKNNATQIRELTKKIVHYYYAMVFLKERIVKEEEEDDDDNNITNFGDDLEPNLWKSFKFEKQYLSFRKERTTLGKRKREEDDEFLEIQPPFKKRDLNEKN